MKKTILLILLLCSYLLPLQAQNRSTRPAKPKNTVFTVDSLPSELRTFLNAATKVEEKVNANNQLIEQFAVIYNNLDENRQKQVVALYNTARGTKMDPLPHYYDLTQTLLAYRHNKVSATLFDEWVTAVTAIPSKSIKTKEIVAFIDYTAQLLADRTIYSSRTSIWQAQADAKYSFEVGKNDIKTIFSSPTNLRYSSGNGKNDDENTLYGTTGTYYFLDNRWEGNGGRITWERCGMPASECFADLSRYTAIVKFPKFTADSVRFINTKYFPSPLAGALEENLNNRVDPEKYNFPKFRSYQKDFQLKDVLPGIDFEGSFMMYGPRFVTNDEKNPASMVFYRNGQRFLVVNSTKFTILPHMLTSERAKVTLYLDSDSISNAGVLVRYTTKDRKVNLLNSPKRNYYSPYTDTYHQFDIYCESINWLMDQDQLEFNMVAQNNTQTFVTFESNRYYSERKSIEVQGIDNVSPVVRVFKYMKEHEMKKDFRLPSFQRFIGMDEAQTKLMVHTLSKAGLVAYDEGTATIHVHDKLIGFYKAISKQEGHDYDALTLESDTKSTNAILDLSTLDLHIHGIEKFVVSDSQLVVVKPYNGDITVKRDRDIIFSGHINVGRFEMNVTNAYFNYKDFKFDLPQVDSLRFFVTDFKNPEKLHAVRTPLYSLVGDLQVDLPNNHCGLTKNKDYPIFNSVQPSYVYYDRPFILGGAYVRDRFYYSLHPFVIKQLTDFQTDSLEFGGTLTSAGIFPDIEQPLKVQRDYSLGFINVTPRSGYPAYGGKGTYFDTVALSYGGLRGKGRLEYLTSVTYTDKYIFLPDSTVAQSDTFYVKPQDGYPDIQNSSTLIRWYPKRDSMTVSQLNKGTRFTMYKGESLLAGRVTLQPKGAAATGTITLHDGTLRSPWFTLHTETMDANVTDFSLRSARHDEIAFKATNMRSHVDYNEHTGEFTANSSNPDSGSLSRTLLPALGYAAWVDRYTWDWDDLFLALDNSHSMETNGLEDQSLRDRAKQLDKMPGAHFESTDPALKDIQFNAISSRYLYNDLELSCRSVFALPIADVVIAPAADTLHISKGGNMTMLKKAQVLASATNSYHLFKDCDIIVENGKKYSGKGTIEYTDTENLRETIKLHSIGLDKEGHTLAEGTLSDSDGFLLSEVFGFAGNVRVEAEKPFYHFNGGVRLIHRCTPNDQFGYLAFANYIDPRDVRISVPDSAVDWKGVAIHTGIRMGATDLKPIPALLVKQQPGIAFLNCAGVLSYNNEAYTVTSQRKLDDKEENDPYVTLHTDDCTLDAEGPLHFGNLDAVGDEKKGYVSIYAYGNTHVDPNEDKNFSLRTVLGVSFPIDNNILNLMAEKIQEDLNPSPADADNEMLLKALVNALGDEKGEEAYNDYNNSGAYDNSELSSISAKMASTLLFENVRWEYNPLRGYTASCVTGLSHVGKKQLHLNVRLKAQFFRKAASEHLVLYIQVSNSLWYYFHYDYKSHNLSISSSVEEWNDRILNLSKDKRTAGNFTYSVTNARSEIQNFLGGFTSDPSDYEEEDEEDEEEEEE